MKEIFHDYHLLNEGSIVPVSIHVPLLLWEGDHSCEEHLQLLSCSSEEISDLITAACMPTQLKHYETIHCPLQITLLRGQKSTTFSLVIQTDLF